MILKEFNYNKQRKLNQLLESRFGTKINFSSLNINKATRLKKSITEHLNTMRKTYGTNLAERNPKYMEMLVVKEGLTAWLDNRRKLLEGELETAEVVLAAKDMVDSIQNMLEDASKMLNEQMPPLLDTIRDQLGPEQADAYKGMAGAALQTLIDNLKSARENLDNGARSLAGEESGMAAGEMGGVPMPGTEMPTADMGSEEDLAAELAQASPAVGGSKPAGRAKR